MFHMSIAYMKYFGLPIGCIMLLKSNWNSGGEIQWEIDKLES